MKLTLTNKKQETKDVTTFVFKPSEPINWNAGQYLHCILPHENQDERGNERWFTISSAPHEEQIQITARHSEKGSTFKDALFNMSVGDEVTANGPEGDFTLANPSEPSVFITGGIGITPFRSILLDLNHTQKPINIKLLYANRNNDFVFKEELDALADKHPNFNITYFVDPKRIDEEDIKSVAPDLTKPTFFVSGPEPMVKSYEKILLDIGAPSEHIKLDDFPGYDWQ